MMKDFIRLLRELRKRFPLLAIPQRDLLLICFPIHTAAGCFPDKTEWDKGSTFLDHGWDFQGCLLPIDVDSFVINRQHQLNIFFLKIQSNRAQSRIPINQSSKCFSNESQGDNRSTFINKWRSIQYASLAIDKR